MLSNSEKQFYNIAYCAATGTSFSATLKICTYCNGTGLLRNPTAYMGVAQCYMCNGGLMDLTDSPRKKLKLDLRESCNANPKTVSARS